MNSFEVERRETLTREEAATRLRRIANLLSESGEEAEFERGGRSSRSRYRIRWSGRSSWSSTTKRASSRSS
jgi:hypothetical protein